MSLHAQNLTLVAGTRTLIADLSFTIEPGQSWALLGRNGAGKSWLIDTLAGLREPARGTISLEGRALSAWPRRDLAARLAVLLQDEGLAGSGATAYWGTVAEYVGLGRFPHGTGPHDAAIVAAAMASLELDTLAGAPLRRLSGGERQRARIAQCLVQSAGPQASSQWLLADEPLNHLDLRHQASVLATLAARGSRGTLLSLHHPTAARAHCSHALLVYDSGRVEHGPIAHVLTDHALRDLYGIDLAG
jgi:iron complex transport system ATP-binding protein